VGWVPQARRVCLGLGFLFPRESLRSQRLCVVFALAFFPEPVPRIVAEYKR